MERKPAAVLAALFNRRLFASGLVLVGSHAYGALLNELGINAAGYSTRDIDVARAQPLAVALPEGTGFKALLEESGLEFAEVPGMPSHHPTASFKLPGAGALAVDLLVPGDDIGKVVELKDLHAHGQAVPVLDFLLREPLDAIALSPNQVVPVKAPNAERFVLHKLFASQSRRADRGKARKDLEQAAVIAAAIEEDTPGALRDAARRLPARVRPVVKRAASAALRLLEGAHPEGREALEKLAGG
jgi:hypothetical protein